MMTISAKECNIDITNLYTVESRFYELPREMKIGSKNRRVREIGGNITVFDRGGETTQFWFEKSGGPKNRGFDK